LIELGPHTNKRYSPCSKFKITLSLIGYDAGILKDEHHPIWEYRNGYVKRASPPPSRAFFLDTLSYSVDTQHRNPAYRFQ